MLAEQVDVQAGLVSGTGQTHQDVRNPGTVEVQCLAADCLDDAEEGEELLGFVSFFPQAEKSIAEAATDNASTTDISFFIILSSNPIPDSFKDLFLMTLYHNEKMCQQVNLP